MKGANLALALLIEIAMLVAFFYWGCRLPLAFPWQWLAGIVAAGIGIALWAVWGAPRSRHRLGMPALWVFKLVMFGAAALALWAAGEPLAAAWLAAISVLHLILAAVWKQV